jgi:hypothetical protein
LAQLPLNSTWFVAETGGKVVYVNQPLTARQLPLAQMKEWPSNREAAKKTEAGTTMESGS